MNNTPNTLTPGEFICDFLVQLESESGPYVYLRNHEALPQETGNDIDLLVERGKRQYAIKVLVNFCQSSHWKIYKCVEFGPISVFLFTDDRKNFMHIDFFDRLDWHWIPYADSRRILVNREWNGRVFRPNPEDEVFVNIFTRLLYQGKIRTKHREQVETAKTLFKPGHIEKIFRDQLKPSLRQDIPTLIEAEQWHEVENRVTNIRLGILANSLLLKPFQTLHGLFRYSNRAIRRIIFPPGLFIVFEGADGVGKTTIINRIKPIIEGLSGRNDTLFFHWKPSSKSIRAFSLSGKITTDPRSKRKRSIPLSLVFLLYHWIGFWWGWISKVRPALTKNRAVIGDRYAYEFFLDPDRLRLNLPLSILKIAAIYTPKPDLVIALTAKPSTILKRKQELSETEIETYQDRLLKLNLKNSRFKIVNSDGEIDSTIDTITEIIIANTSDPTHH